jgi:hypothetical protein
MVLYNFKILGVMDENAEREIDVVPNDTVEDVKEKVRKSYRFAPQFLIELLFDGTKLIDRHIFSRLAINPKKQKVMVIVTRPETM